MNKGIELRLRYVELIREGKDSGTWIVFVDKLNKELR